MSVHSNEPSYQDFNDAGDPEFQNMIRKLKINRFRDIQNGNFEVLRHDPQKEIGLVQYIRTDYTNNVYLCKNLRVQNWYKTNLDIEDLIRHMKSLKGGFQEFQGYYVKDDHDCYMIFERPIQPIEDHIQKLNGREKDINNVFFTILEALCELECVGLHHPSINGRSVFLVESKIRKIKMSNPFLYDSFMDEFVHVYRNPVNTAYGKRSFNKRKLQENVYEMCLLVLSLLTKTPSEIYLEQKDGGYNYNAINKSLSQIPPTYSQKLKALLLNVLSRHVDCSPTPLALCNQLGFDQPGNSYYKHSTDFYKNFDPFEKPKKSKIFSDHEEPNIPIPNVDDLNKTRKADLEMSKMIGTQHRRKNNFIMDCDYYKQTLRPYKPKTKVEEDILPELDPEPIEPMPMEPMPVEPEEPKLIGFGPPVPTESFVDTQMQFLKFDPNSRQSHLHAEVKGPMSIREMRKPGIVQVAPRERSISPPKQPLRFYQAPARQTVGPSQVQIHQPTNVNYKPVQVQRVPNTGVYQQIPSNQVQQPQRQQQNFIVLQPQQQQQQQRNLIFSSGSPIKNNNPYTIPNNNSNANQVYRSHVPNFMSRGPQNSNLRGNGSMPYSTVINR